MRQLRHMWAMLLCALLLLSPAQAQISGAVFFRATTDTSGDLRVDARDRAVLWTSDLFGLDIRPLSDDADNVIEFSVSPDGQSAAYITRAGSVETLVIVPLDGSEPTRIPLSDVTGAHVTADDTVIWLDAKDSEGIPLVRGYELDGTLVAEQTLEYPDSVLRFSHDLDYLMGFNLAMGIIAIYDLPEFEELEFDIPNVYGLTVPVWSPNSPTLLIPVGVMTAEADFLFLMVDAPPSESREVELPDYPEPENISFEWSATGAQVAYRVDSPGLVNPLVLVDTVEGTVATLEIPGSLLEAVAWSHDESYAVLRGYPLDDEALGSDLYLLDATTSEITLLDSFAPLDIAGVSWHPFAPLLVVSAQSVENGFYGIYEINAVQRSVTPLFETFDSGLLNGAVYYADDGASVVFSSTSPDPVITTFINAVALYGVDPATGETRRLSPENALVDPITVIVR